VTQDTKPMSEEELSFIRSWGVLCDPDEKMIGLLRRLVDDYRRLNRELEEAQPTYLEHAKRVNQARAEEREACIEAVKAAIEKLVLDGPHKEVLKVVVCDAIRARGKPDVQPVAPGEAK